MSAIELEGHTFVEQGTYYECEDCSMQLASLRYKQAAASTRCVNKVFH